jgi:hypothetical protein
MGISLLAADTGLWRNRHSQIAVTAYSAGHGATERIEVKLACEANAGR